MKKLIGAALCAAMMVVPVSPAHAEAGGSGVDMTSDDASGRFISGGGSYLITPGVNSSNVTVVYECHAVAGPDADQTRIRPGEEGGCVLYKGNHLFYASGQAAPGGVSFTVGTAEVDLAIGGRFMVCWSVSATFSGDGWQELSNAGCSAVRA